MSKGQNEVPEAVIEFSDFPGLFLLQNPIRLQPGAAQDQLNIKCDVANELNVRSGVLPIVFDFQA